MFFRPVSFLVEQGFFKFTMKRLIQRSTWSDEASSKSTKIYKTVTVIVNLDLTPYSTTLDDLDGKHPAGFKETSPHAAPLTENTCSIA